MNKDKLFLFFDKLSKFGLGGVFFFIPISNGLIETFTGFALLGFTGKKLIRSDFEYLKTKQNVFLATFFFFMALSLINSGQYLDKGLVALLLKWGKYVGLSLILQDTIKSRKDVFIFTGIFIFSAVLVSISGITQLFWGVEFLRGKKILINPIIKHGVRAMTSSFSHSNGLGAYLIIPFTLCVAFLKSPSILKRKLYCFVLFLGLILAFCIFHTYSRGAWVGVIAALIAMLFISRKLKIVILVVVLCGFVFFIPAFRETFFSIFKAGGDSSRFEYWQVAVTMFRENPLLGKGLGTFMARFSSYLPMAKISYVHNCFLQILAESGIFSLFAFLGFIFLVLNNGIRKFLSVGNPVLLGGVCGLIGFLVHSFFEVSLYSLPLATLFWLWIGMVSVLGSGRIAE